MRSFFAYWDVSASSPTKNPSKNTHFQHSTSFQESTRWHTTYFIGGKISKYIAFTHLKYLDRILIGMFIYLRFYDFTISIIFALQHTSAIHNNNGENGGENGQKSNFVFHLLNWHGIRCKTSIKSLNRLGGFVFMSLSIYISSERMNQRANLDIGFCEEEFKQSTFLLWF